MAITLKDLYIKDSRNGIQIVGPAVLDASGITFDGVEKPWDIDPRARGTIQGTRIRNDPKVRNPTNRVSKGWRRLAGPPLPAFCPTCKCIFGARNYPFAGMYWEFWNNEEVCPNCGFEHAKLSEGIFNLARETVEVLSAPDMTFALMAALAATTESFARKRTGSAKALTEIGGYSPKLAHIFKKAMRHGGAAVIFVATIVGVFVAWESLKVGKEQLQLQKDASTDRLLGEILEEFRRPDGGVLVIPRQMPNNSANKPNPTGPSKAEANEKSDTMEGATNRRTKNRYLRKASDVKRRENFGGARHR